MEEFRRLELTRQRQALVGEGSEEQKRWDAMGPFRIEQELRRQALEHRAKAAARLEHAER